jgi:hypothetical protein
LAAPTLNTIDNSVCKKITIFWTDNANNEKAYHVLRGGVQIADLAAASNTYTDTPPSTDVSYSYTVRAWTDVPNPPGSRESASSNSLDALNRPCVANLGNSSKTLTNPANPNDLKDKTVATFLITLPNPAVSTTGADVQSITDTSTANLKNLRVISVSGLTCSPSVAGCVSGTSINATGVIPQGSSATIQVQMDVSTISTSSELEQLSNTVEVFYKDVNGDGTLKHFTRTAGPFLIKSAKARVPSFREVAP